MIFYFIINVLSMVLESETFFKCTCQLFALNEEEYRKWCNDYNFKDADDFDNIFIKIKNKNRIFSDLNDKTSPTECFPHSTPSISYLFKHRNFDIRIIKQDKFMNTVTFYKMSRDERIKFSQNRLDELTNLQNHYTLSVRTRLSQHIYINKPKPCNRFSCRRPAYVDAFRDAFYINYRSEVKIIKKLIKILDTIYILQDQYNICLNDKETKYTDESFQEAIKSVVNHCSKDYGIAILKYESKLYEITIELLKLIATYIMKKQANGCLQGVEVREVK